MFRFWRWEISVYGKRVEDRSWWHYLDIRICFVFIVRYFLHLINRFVFVDWLRFDPISLTFESNLSLHPLLDLSILLFVVYNTIISIMVRFTDHNRLLAWLMLRDVVLDYVRIFEQIEQIKASKVLERKLHGKRVPLALEWLAPNLFSHERLSMAASAYRSKYFPLLTLNQRYEILWKLNWMEVSNLLYTVGMAILSIFILVCLIYQQITTSAQFDLLLFHLPFILIDSVLILAIVIQAVRMGTFLMCTGQLYALFIHMNLNIGQRILTSTLQPRLKMNMIARRLRLLRREYIRIVCIILKTNQELFCGLGSLLVFYALPLNALYAVMLLTFKLSFTTQIFVIAVCSVQLTEMVIIILGCAKISAHLHSGGGRLVTLEGRLSARRSLDKWIVLRLFEMLETRQVVAISMGPVSKMTKEVLIHMIFVYGAYLMFVTDFIRTNSFLV